MSHEVSVTFSMTTSSGKKVWVNAASVNPDDPDGPGFSEDEVRKRVMSGVQEAHSISDTHRAAISKAKARSRLGRDAPAAAMLLGKR